jgi:hypothetical protein
MGRRGMHAVPKRPDLDFLCKALFQEDLQEEDLRLEHKLQTAMKATAQGAIAISLNCLRYRREVLAAVLFLLARASRARFRLSCSFKGIDVAC